MHSSRFGKAIVTSGPTREWIDPVRYLSNASSGKMGFHIAQALLAYPLEVIYIHGNTLEKYSEVLGAKRSIPVETTIDLCDAVLSEITDDSLLIMAAAPADFRPIHTAKQKIKKEHNSGEKNGLILELEENPDVLVQVSEYVRSKNIKNSVRVGFAAETENLEIHAKAKIDKKGIDWIIGNYVGAGKGFGDVDSTVIIYNRDGMVREIGPLPKEDVGKQIVDFLMSST